MSSPSIGPESQPSHGLPPLPLPSPMASAAAPPKSPGLALLLSLILPGIGQVYNGQPAKAFVFFFAFVGSIYGAAQIDPFPFAFLIPFVHIYNLIDAYRSAILINARFMGGIPLPADDVSESPAWGIALIALGLLILLNNLELLNLARLARFWPALLILAGASFLRGSIQRRKEPESRDGQSF